MIEELKEQYRQTLPDKVSTIKLLLQELRAGNNDAIEKLRHMAHTLHGSGSTFGFPDISIAAKQVEYASDDELLKQLAQLIRALLAASKLTDEAEERPAILIIDDDTDITRLLQALVGQHCADHQVVVTATAAEAMPWINQRGFDLIVLDLLLPDSDGRHLLKLLREGRHRNTSVFVLSGVDRPAIRDECLALGATRFYTKPFNPAAIAEAIASEVKGTPRQPPATETKAAPAAEAKPLPATGKPALPVLVAEDDELLVNVIRHRLLREGLQVEHVNNGAAALAALERRAFCLVLLDVKMPMMDGFEVLARLRQQHDKATLPVIMLTAMGSEKDVVRGYDLGASDYVLKPFSPVELMAKVKSQLRLG
jgi:DNA-binding response OmpR family regulator